MAGLVDSKENIVLDAILGDATHFPNPIFVGIMTAEPNDDGTGVTEPSGMAYERVSVANTLAEWPAASGGQKANASTITFPAATGDWGTITHFGIFDAISGGNLLAFGSLNVSRVVWSADIFRFLVDDLIVTLD